MLHHFVPKDPQELHLPCRAVSCFCDHSSGEMHLELEVDGECGVTDSYFLSIRQKLLQLALQVGTSLLLETGRCRIVERLLLGSDRGLLELCFRSLCEMLQELLQCPLLLDIDHLGQIAANRTVVLLLMLECVCIDAVVATVHHVVVFFGVAQEGCGARHDLEGFKAARGGDNGVGRGDSRDDVLDNTLSHRVGDSGDVVFLCAFQRLCE